MAMQYNGLDTEALKERLVNEPAPVAYDVELGLARHQQLLQTQSSLPEWATEQPTASAPLGLRKVGWWLVGTLVLVTAAARLAGPLATPAQPAGELGRATREAAAPEPSDASAVQPALAQARGDGRRAAEARPPAIEAAESAAREPQGEVTPADHALPAVRLAAPAFANEADPSALGRVQSAPRREPNLELRARSDRPRATSEGRPIASGRTRPPRRNPGVPLDAEEMRQLTRAEDLLAAAPLEALLLAREGEVRFRTGYFTQERRYVEVMALFALQRRDEAEAQARWFLRDYPDSPYRRRVERARQRALTR